MLLTLLGFGASCSTVRHQKSRGQEPKQSDADSSATVADTAFVAPEIRLMYGPPVYFEGPDGLVQPGAARVVEVPESDGSSRPADNGGSGTDVPSEVGNGAADSGEAAESGPEMSVRN